MKRRLRFEQMESRRLLAADICQVAHVGDTSVADPLCASLGFEPDDHVDEIGADATPIELVPSDGALVGGGSGLIEVTGDVDVFQFELTAGEEVSIEFLPVLLESSSMSLFDSDGAIISTAVSPGFLIPASITESLEAGTFYISVTGTNSIGVGDYTLDLVVGEFDSSDPPTDDHVDTIGPDATEIELVPSNGALYGNEFGIIETSGDIDVFQFEVSQGDDVVIQLVPFLLDTTTLSLLDSDGGLVAEAISSGVFAPATIEASLASGTYFVSVTGENAAGAGEYTLDVTIGDFDDPDPAIDDHVDEIGPDATEIELMSFSGALNGSEFGIIETSGDVDVFQFDVFEADEVAVHFQPTLLDASSVSLLDSNGETIASANSDGIFIPASLSELIQPGTFYIAVTGETMFGVGDYTIDVTVGEIDDSDPPTDDHVDTIGSDATSIVLEQFDDVFLGSAFGTIEVIGDIDVFQFDVIAEDLATIQLAQQVPGTATLELLSADGTVLASSVNQNDFESILVETTLAAGTYYLSATIDSDFIPGQYSIDVALGDFDDPNPTDDHVDEIGPDATPIVLDPFEGALVGSSFGVLETNDDVDVFQFDVAEPDVVAITGLGFLLDSTTFQLIGNDGVVISEVQSDGIFTPVEISETLEAGTYYISVAGMTSLQVAEYTIDLRVGDLDSPDPPADDHVDEIGPDATPLVFEDESGTQLASENGFLGTADDIDVFQFDLEQTDLVTISLFQFTLPTATLGLVDVATGVVTEVTARPFENPEASAELQPGTYYLVVNSNEGGVGDYFLDVRVGDPGISGDDHADTLGPDATDIVFSEFNGGVFGSGSGVIELPGDVDVFEFEMATDDEVILSGTHSAPLTVQLLDQDGNNVAISQSSDEANSTYLAQSLDSGIYYLAVSSTDSISGNAYSFNVYVEDADTAIDDHADVIGLNATDLLVDASGTDFTVFGIGTLENRDDIDMFQFSLPAAFDVTLLPLDLGSPIEFGLLDADGNLLAETDDFATAPLTLDEGTYYVSVSGRVGASVPNASFLFFVSGTQAAGTKVIPHDGHGLSQSSVSVSVSSFETDDSSDDRTEMSSGFQTWMWLAE